MCEERSERLSGAWPASTISRTAAARPMPTTAYCAANPMGWRGYSKDFWGLTARDGPGEVALPLPGNQASSTATPRAARSRARRHRRRHDCADSRARFAAFAPEIVIPWRMRFEACPALFDRYGFKDSFNPSFTYADLKIKAAGRSEARLGCQGLSRHRPGADPAPGRQLSRRFRLEYMRRVPAIVAASNARVSPAAGLLTDRANGAELRHAAFVESFDPHPVRHALVERAKLFGQGCAVTDSSAHSWCVKVSRSGLVPKRIL